MTLEDAIVYTALSYVGVSADPQQPEARARFEDLMGYDETPEVKRSMSSYKGISTCGLFIRGLIWHVFHEFQADVDLHEIAPPYLGKNYENSGKVFENLEDLGARCHAIEDFRIGMWPDAGDVVMVGLDTKSDGHTYLVTGRNGNVIEAVDAGQVTKAGFQAVRAKSHTWTQVGAKMNDHAVQLGKLDTFQGSDKNVSKIIRLKKLEAALLAA